MFFSVVISNISSSKPSKARTSLTLAMGMEPAIDPWGGSVSSISSGMEEAWVVFSVLKEYARVERSEEMGVEGFVFCIPPPGKVFRGVEPTMAS